MSRRRERGRWLWILTFVFFVLVRSGQAEAADRESAAWRSVGEEHIVRRESGLRERSDWETELSDYDFSGIEEVLEETLGELSGRESISFSEVVKQLVEGNLTVFFTLLWDYVGDILLGELRMGRKAAWRILLLAVAGAVFTNLAQAFPESTASQTGFAVVYMVLSSLLFVIFDTAVSVAAESFQMVGRLMSAFLPVFFLAVAVQGQLTAAAMYEFSLLLIRGVQCFFENVLLIGVQIWVVLRILDGILPEKFLSRMSGLLGKFLQGAVKTGLGLVIGFQTVQALLLPYLDAAKNGTLMKLAGAIPGVGGSVEAAAQMALGTAALVRNGIGMAGLLVLVLVSLAPLMKLGFLAFTYHGLAAFLQPVSDKRILEAAAAVGDGCGLLFQILGAGIVLFGVSIGLACACFGRVGV